MIKGIDDAKAIFDSGMSDKARRISWISEQADRTYEYNKGDLERISLNEGMYWGTNFKQWPAEVVEKLRSEGRRPPTIPVISSKAETLLGSVIANGFDINIQARNPSSDHESMLLSDLMYADSNITDWESTEMKVVLDSLIACGYERMRITDKYSPFGNVSFERLNPKNVLLDPTWRDNDVNNIRCYFYFDDLYPRQIIEAFPQAAHLIKMQYDKDRIDGIDSIDLMGNHDDYTFERKWVKKHRVWEYHSMRHVSENAEFDLVNDTFLPDSGYEPGSKEDKMVKLEYMRRSGLTPDDVVMLKRNRSIKTIEVVCPTLSRSTMLASGPDPVQCGNCNIFPLGLRFDGQIQGLIVDRMYDLQIAINKGEMNIQDTMTRSAKGAFMLDGALAGGDPIIKKQIEEAWNDPAARIWLDDYSTKNLPNGGIIKLPGSEVSNDTYQNLSRYYSLTDQFSTVGAAMGGRTESSKESGKLFRAKFEAGQISQKYLFKLLERHKRDKVVAWIEVAKILYAGAEMIALRNARSKNIEELEFFDITKISNQNVVVTPSPKGISLRNDKRNESAELITMLMGPNDALLRMLALEEVVMLSDMDDDKREEYKKAFALTKLGAAVQLQATIVQGQQIIQQAQQPPPMPQGAPQVQTEQVPPEQPVQEEQPIQGV